MAWYNDRPYWLPSPTELGWDAEFYRGFLIGMNFWALILAVIILTFVIIITIIKPNVGMVFPLGVSVAFLIYTSTVAFYTSGILQYQGDWSTWPTPEELGWTERTGAGVLLGYALFDFVISFSLTLTVALMPARPNAATKAALMVILILWVMIDIFLILSAAGYLELVVTGWGRYWR